jgi:hypothetical protein
VIYIYDVSRLRVKKILIIFGSPHILTKCTVQEAKSPIKISHQAALRGGI